MSKASELSKLRKIESRPICEDMELDEMEGLSDYYERILHLHTEQSLIEYRNNLDTVHDEFKLKTNLSDIDIAFLGIATALQCARIYLVNKFTEIEKAGKGKREDFLHKKQEKLLGSHKTDSEEYTSVYYAPLNQIVGTPGVPYDATAYAEEKYGLFKGANHRFSTLGHDPVLGLIIGTGNILTNTITCSSGLTEVVKIPLISTYHVNYEVDFTKAKSYRVPQIGNLASTALMLKYAADRACDETEAFVAAFIKQIIHIGTDLYTPCGIQLPALNLLTSKKNVELLTRYISTGDVVKASGSASISIFINKLIALLHRCLYIGMQESLDEKVYEIRTRKIIMYSNVFATSSNIILTALSGLDPTKLDFGGFCVTAYRIMTDTKFIKEVKYEYLNVKTSEIYYEKIKDNLKYY